MDINKQLEIIKRGCSELISEPELIDKLKKKKKLKIKLGFDPTAPDIHLGHTVVLQKLKQFQDLGHEICLIIGDFTAMIGDPSGRSSLRPALSESEIKKNAATYVDQVAKILDIKKTRILYNSSWLGKMSVLEFARLGTKQTVARMLERDDFEKRLKQGHDITILEFYYPLLQAQDSVEIKSDVELGGTDQKFNLLMGRTIQKRSDQDQQVVLTMPLLVGIDGSKKMSKTYNNYIGVSELPENIFGKVMSISDELMWMYYELLSQKDMDEIKKIKEDVKKEILHPKKAKELLAFELVEKLYSKIQAESAKEHFDKVIVNKQKPDSMSEFKIDSKKQKQMCIVDIIAETKMVVSKSEIRRLIGQGGVSINGNKISNISMNFSTDSVYEIKIGKRKFAKVEFI